MPLQTPFKKPVFNKPTSPAPGGPESWPRRAPTDLTGRYKTWSRERRRAKAAKSRPRSRKTSYLLGLSLLLLLGSFFAALKYLEPAPAGRQLTIDQFSALADEQRLQSATFLDQDNLIEGEFLAEPAQEAISPPATDDEDARTEPEPPLAEAPEGSGPYWVGYPESGAITSVLVETALTGGAEVTTDSQVAKQTVRVASTFLLPLMILANLFGLLFTASRGSSSGIGEVMMFGTVGARRAGKEAKPVKFSDVAGAEEAVAELREVRDYLQDPQRYEEIGAAPPKGVLLVGPPGCGKTLLAKAVAGEASVPFFSVAGAEFVESLVGIGAARVRDLFARVRAAAPAIVFIDELDAAGRRRGAGGGVGGSDEREQTLNQILVEMDGFQVSSGIVVMAATNRPDILDPALLRPGRFDRHVTIEQPDVEGRREILELHAKGKPTDPSVDFRYLATRTPGFSGADLASVINEAALLTVRAGQTTIGGAILEEAVQRVLSGPQKKGRVLEPEERRRAAFHESGHAIVAAALGRPRDVSRLSILARGKGIGATGLRRESDAVVVTRTELFARLMTLFGGLASERLVFGEISTGVESDLERASELARDIVGRFGMGTKRRRLLGRELDEYLGGDVALASISSRTHEDMEAEIDRLLHSAEEECVRLLTRYREQLDVLAARLEKEEHLEGRALEQALAGIAPEASPNGEVIAPLPVESD